MRIFTDIAVYVCEKGLEYAYLSMLQKLNQLSMMVLSLDVVPMNEIAISRDRRTYYKHNYPLMKPTFTLFLSLPAL